MKKTFLSVALCACAAFALAQKPAATPTPDHHDRQPTDIFRVQPLPGGVYALYGRGGNIGFFVGPDAVLVVDSQFKDIAPGIVEQIRKVSDKPIKFLLNTHHHGDHVGGNEVFRQFAMIVAHDNVRTRMLASPWTSCATTPRCSRSEEGRQREVRQVLRRPDRVGEEGQESRRSPRPSMTFDSELRIYIGAETIEIWHLPPAHTDGDSVVYFEKAKVLHMGDVFFNKVIPFIDVKGGGSVRGYLDGARQGDLAGAGRRRRSSRGTAR